MKAKPSLTIILVFVSALLIIVWAVDIQEPRASAETFKQLTPQILLTAQPQLSPTAPISGQSIAGLSSSCDQPDRCTISSQSGWFATPLVLRQGDNFNVAYLDGTWTVDIYNWPYVGPEGYSPEIDNQIGYESLCKTDISLPYATLLGKIGNSGSIFAVGRGGSFTASTSGPLYLRINDNEICQDDNDGSIRVHISTASAPPSNDDFDHASLFPEPPPNGLANQHLDLDTNNATVAPDDPDMGCGAGVNSHTLWFKLLPSYYGRVRIRTYSTLDPAASSNYDTVVAVFTGQRGSLNRIACNDDAPGHEPLSDLTFEAEAGKTYYIEVASYGDTPGGTLSLFVNYEVEPKAWTLMFFTAGDNDINQETRLTRQYALLAQASKNLNVNIVVFWDGVVSDARYDVFSPTYGNDRILKGELSTGDPGVLQDFVRWAMQNYPAEHYALIISDHGHGIHGVAQDRDPSDDTLTMKELSEAFLPLPKIDVLYMDACLMGTLDSAYELNGLIDYYVASESVTWGSIRPDWFILGTPDGELLAHVTQDTSPRDLAIAMAQSYEMAHMSEYQPSTISVVDVAAVSDVATKTSTLAGLLKNRMSSVKQTLDGILADVQRFDERDLPWVTNKDRLIDLYHFASLVRSRITDTDIQNAATSLMNSIDNYVIFNSKWSGWATVNGDKGFWNHENAYGVSVLFPSPDTRECYYNGDWVGFAAGTDWHCQGSSTFALSPEGITFEWGSMLVEYLERTNPSAPDNWNPPELVAPLTLSQIYLPVVLRSFGSTPSPTPTPTPTPPPSSPAIRVEPTSGPLGTRFNIYGSGFVPGESVQQWVIIPGGDRFDDPTPQTVDSQGNYTSWIQIDYGPSGTYTLYARGSQSQQTVSAQFVITSSGVGGSEGLKAPQMIWSK